MCPQREAAVICCGFILLYCEIDSSLKISPVARIPIEKAISVMKNYISNPGYVVTVIRKTKEYIEREMVSVETIKRINDLLTKVTIEQVKAADKTYNGLVIYELIVCAVKYYKEFARMQYNVDIFEKNLNDASVLNTKHETSGYSIKPAGVKNLDTSETKTNRADSETQNFPDKKPENEPVLKRKVLITTQKDLKTSEIRKSDISKPKKISSSLKPTQVSKLQLQTLKKSESPQKKKNDFLIINSPKPLDKNIIAAKRIILTTKNQSRSTKTTPIRNRKSLSTSRSFNDSPCNHRDVLEEMQYHQFIEEKFRHFLIEKLRVESQKFIKGGVDKSEVKAVNERKALELKYQ